MAISITKPVVGGSVGTWGTELNSALDTIVTGVNTALAGGGGGSGIPASTVTAKGDLILGTGVGAVNRQAVGTNGNVLVADNTQTNGVSWKVPPGTLVLKATKTSAQTIASGTGQFLTYTPDFVNTNFGSASGGFSSYTPGVAGWYEINGGVAFSSNSTGVRGAWVVSAGTEVAGSASTVMAVNGLATCVSVRPTVVQLTAGQAVAVFAYQTSGAGLDTYYNVGGLQYGSTLTVKWLGS